MCDCIRKIEEKLKNQLAENNKNNPEFSNMEIESVSCQDVGFIAEGEVMKCVLTIPFEIRHKPIGRKKKTIVNMTTKYCPFCGKPTEEGE